MRKLIPIENPKNLKEGDIIIYGKSNGSCLYNYTKGKEYEIIDFYDNKSGIVLIDDTGERSQICNGNVKHHFRLLIDEPDNVNHPPHYTWLKDKCGIEVIDITRHMDFCLGNAIKYILRAGRKQDASLTDNQKEIEDLKKAIFYISDRVKQLGGEIRVVI